jgi:hypothetical protein
MQILRDALSIESSIIRELFDYWRGKCRGTAIPRRTDIDPAEILPILPNLMIVDFEQQPFRVRFRLVGTKVVEITGFEFTGRYLDEIVKPDVEAAFIECYETASRTKQPVFDRIKWRFDDQITGEYDFAVLPLDDDGEVAMRALAIECYARLERRYDLAALRRRSPARN